MKLHLHYNTSYFIFFLICEITAFIILRNFIFKADLHAQPLRNFKKFFYAVLKKNVTQNSEHIEQENRSRERVRLRGTEIHRSTTVPEAPDSRDVSNAGNAMDGIIAGLR